MEYIRESVSIGIHKSAICPRGKGSALGKALSGKTEPSKTNVDEWFNNAQKLRREFDILQDIIDNGIDSNDLSC